MEKIILMALFVFLFGCSSTKKEPEPREFKKDYEVVDASNGVIPSWIDAPTTADSGSEIQAHRYFVSESKNSSKRLCMKSSQARASAKIAGEVAQFIKNSYAEGTQGGGDEEVTQYMEESLAQEAQTFLVGASVHKTYWEKRRFKQELGATEDETSYNCYALIKMPRKLLEKAVANSLAKLYTSIANPEIKGKAQKALKGAEEAFSKLEQ